MQTGKTILSFLICVALLGACGHKGPLYLPEETPASEQESIPDNGEDKEKKTSEKDASIPRS